MFGPGAYRPDPTEGMTAMGIYLARDTLFPQLLAARA